MVKSFLSNRKSVKSGTICSDWTTINDGVTQGTVVGLIIFIVYIDDISEKLKSKEVLQFADDTCIIYYSKTNQCLHKKTFSFFQKND